MTTKVINNITNEPATGVITPHVLGTLGMIGAPFLFMEGLAIPLACYPTLRSLVNFRQPQQGYINPQGKFVWGRVEATHPLMQ